MKLLKTLAAAAVLAAPMLVSTAPAQALTAHQYQTQGRGAYVSSKARGYGWRHRYGHRSWYRQSWRRHHWRRY